MEGIRTPQLPGWYFPELEDTATMDPIGPGESIAIAMLQKLSVAEILALPEDGDDDSLPVDMQDFPVAS